ncbi:3'(2'),5'-bisphosphate nucleotidase [Terasakiispira papahanaumokuakeensis]|uniref:3'(2'),5'-bisphosphate nucleotidase CysQ n=1 Tax=Terasakiispira papahanaumokuakeensis TaxID=197479 RepID=A0A1E2VD01_9GAMM|nr:3'(2'),5'-bisphosphate nucleotidase CysQ [Terasakiispira papahanaumokuakeensis]ODC04696.1 3'(2'),5'-bisphosphate nucleotidase [Terasakiispira papahanaumokuakeensis]
MPNVLSPALLEQVERIAREAGNAIMRIYAEGFTVEQKEDLSPLTEADQAAHNIIAKGLQRLELQAPILSEEDLDAFQAPDVHGRYWLVDPLDGTKEFIRRNGEFTVNIALIEDGIPILGAVFAPALGTAYLAMEGQGAIKVWDDGTRTPIETPTVPVESRWRVVGSRSHPSPDLDNWLEALGDHVIVPMGSSLKLCLVAEGEADLYPRLGPTSLWDIAAAHAVLREAGGNVVTLEGEPLSYADPHQRENPHFIAHGAGWTP